MLGQHVTNLRIGRYHIVALTKEGAVYGWGRNDQSQLTSEDCVEIRHPKQLVKKPSTFSLAHLACGPNHSLIWFNNPQLDLDTRIPFVLDIKEDTFRLLDFILNEIWNGLDISQCNLDRPPKQETECITVTILNLIRFHFHAILVNKLELCCK